MKNNTAVFIHNKLNELYSTADEVFNSFKNIPNIETSQGFFNGNYMKVHNRYDYQKYPIPVISIKNKGDIGVDLNAIWFEFFLDKNSFNNIPIEELINNYNVEIYGGKNCLTNFYKPGKTLLDMSKDIKNSSEESIGISISLEYITTADIRELFFKVCSLLNI